MFHTIPTLCPQLSVQVFECENIAPTLALPNHRAWYVQVEWELEAGQPWPLNGNWLVQVFLKPCGQRREICVPATGPEKVAVIPSQTTYCHKLTVALEISEATLYQLATVLTLENSLGELAPVARVVAGPLIQFYETN